MNEQRRPRDTYTSAPPVPLLDGDDLAMPEVPERAIVPALLGVRVEDPLAPLSGRPAHLSVRCHACHHRCVIRESRVGVCGVRANRAGSLVSLVYGEAVVAHAEAIEKKPFFHVLPGTTSFSIATRGCNFHCAFCQNWEIAQAPRERIRPAAEPLPPADVVRIAQTVGARSIAYTYVEPTVFLEYALDTARLAHLDGLANVFVTNGYETPEALELLAPVLDAANVDLKGFNAGFYRSACGARLEHVLESLVEMRRLGIWVEVTTLVVPGANDDAHELAAAAEWIGTNLGPETPWHVSRFFPAHRMSDAAATPIDTLRRTVTAGRSVGLRHVYLGNAGEADETDTRCARCNRVVVQREGSRIGTVGLWRGRCPDCGAPLAGFGLEDTGDGGGQRDAREVSA
jgi:pyruvate formate lyase activating enzyme